MKTKCVDCGIIREFKYKKLIMPKRCRPCAIKKAKNGGLSLDYL